MDFIEIKGYKSIKNAKIELAPINILIGANGSGKSNFISFFDFLNSLYEKKLRAYVALNGGENKMLHRGKKVTDELYFHLEFDGGRNGYAAELKLGVEGLIFAKELSIYEGNSAEISNYGEEAAVKYDTTYRSRYVREYLQGLRKYHFHDTSSKSPFTNMSHIENDIFYLYPYGDNLAAYLYHIRATHPKYYNRILQTIQSVAPYFSDFYLEPNSEKTLRLLWKDKYSDIIYGANDFSDGTLRFIALTVLFMQPKLPDTIIIDEPELGLHPFAINKLSGMIKSASKKGCQIIAATQSVELLSLFEPEDVITVDQVNGESQFKRLNRDDLKEWLEDYYSIGELWKKNIFGGQPNYNL
ncbi:AAA family ATPase [Porphyromonas levii]|nr:AAA family ATPase [Porphyromonas levii]MBR8712474.1 hypothetical protein [Porphyromonas levii]MBR8714466.1 hypothetical protein [Porphyromonas levii]MBR8727007.1 hypothetical protein [Porphyromonas levii]MBR8735406.1 hypothetical protein [Porphyromonas levii]MBR8773397.1 hypothetical protein [Porphyromonas levii]